MERCDRSPTLLLLLMRGKPVDKQHSGPGRGRGPGNEEESAADGALGRAPGQTLRPPAGAHRRSRGSTARSLAAAEPQRAPDAAPSVPATAARVAQQRQHTQRDKGDKLRALPGSGHVSRGPAWTATQRSRSCHGHVTRLSHAPMRHGTVTQPCSRPVLPAHTSTQKACCSPRLLYPQCMTFQVLQI